MTKRIFKKHRTVFKKQEAHEQEIACSHQKIDKIWLLLIVTYSLLGNSEDIRTSVTIAVEQSRDKSFIFAHVPTLETERCILRALRLEDAKDIFEFASDPRVAELTVMFSLHATLDQVLEYVQTRINEGKKGQNALWAVVYKETGKVIGLIGLFAYSPRHAKAEIGYAYARAFWNKGIATEVAKAIVWFGLNTLCCHRVQATVHPHNSASIRVLEKCGMSYEGLLRCYYIMHGNRSDRKMYSIIKEDLIK